MYPVIFTLAVFILFVSGGSLKRCIRLVNTYYVVQAHRQPGARYPYILNLHSRCGDALSHCPAVLTHSVVPVGCLVGLFFRRPVKRMF